MFNKNKRSNFSFLKLSVFYVGLGRPYLALTRKQVDSKSHKRISTQKLQAASFYCVYIHFDTTRRAISRCSQAPTVSAFFPLWKASGA